MRENLCDGKSGTCFCLNLPNSGGEQSLSFSHNHLHFVFFTMQLVSVWTFYVAQALDCILGETMRIIMLTFSCTLHIIGLWKFVLASLPKSYPKPELRLPNTVTQR